MIMEFKKLEIDDYSLISPFFQNNYLDICVYSPGSILVWRADNYYPVYSKENDILYIGAKFVESEDENHLILPLTQNKELISPDKLYSKIKNSMFSHFKYVPESYFEIYPKEQVEEYFEIKEITADSDYVYLRKNLADLPGRKLAKKRNLINQFLKEYEGRYKFTNIHDKNKAAVLNFLDRWCLQRDCEEDPESDIFNEKKAAENAVLNCEALGFKTLVLEIDNEIRGFAIGADLTDEMGVLHFQKACFKIKGVYQFFDKNCAMQIFDEKTLFINKESDMDDEGLRKAKKSYYPEKIISSYNLVPK